MESGKPGVDPLAVLEDEELFNLTLSLFKPVRAYEPKKKPVQRIRFLPNKRNKFLYNPDPNKVIFSLREAEGVTRTNLSKKIFREELRASNIRLNRVKNGASLFKILQEENRLYELENPAYRYKNVKEKLEGIPGGSSIEAPKKIEFILPTTSTPVEPVSLATRIDSTSRQIGSIIQAQNRSRAQMLEKHNDMISLINHSNSRRLRAMKDFYEDAARNGFLSARNRAKRATLKSRLKSIGNLNEFPWWHDFLEFAFNGKFGKMEEDLVKSISKMKNLNNVTFFHTYKEYQNRRNSKRCLELLDWINVKANVVDENLSKIIREPNGGNLSVRRKNHPGEA